MSNCKTHNIGTIRVDDNYQNSEKSFFPFGIWSFTTIGILIFKRGALKTNDYLQFRVIISDQGS